MITTKALKQAIQNKLDKNASLMRDYAVTLRVSKVKTEWQITIENDYRKVNAVLTQLGTDNEVLLDSQYGYAGKSQGLYTQSDLELIADILNRQL